MTVPDGLIRQCVEHLDAEFAILDGDGIIRYTNQSWQQFAVEGGFPGDPAMTGEDYLAACRASRDEDEYAAAACAGIEALLAGDRDEYTLEYPCPAPKKPFQWFIMFVNVVSHDGERYLVIQHIDITDRKRFEQKLGARNELLENVGSILSHDLHNPLGAALSWIEVIQHADEVNPDHVTRIERALHRMDEIIDDALFLARGLQVDNTDSVELERAVRSSWEQLESSTATLKIDSLPTIEANESLVQTLLDNLFRNSLEHVGPTVTVTVGALDSGFYIEDDGPGIPPDEREHIFQTGYTTRSTPSNTGMGLPIVQAVAQAHGWDITVTGGSTGGARFEITGVATGDHSE